ncbi:MAG TPA: F-box protein, partial [Gammaproteobacteria bacterium]|nr:F-box protein [Gammaproteobacteria bacterium]
MASHRNLSITENHTNKLPTEILSQVFLLLNAQSFCRASQVCHFWQRTNTLLDEQRFKSIFPDLHPRFTDPEYTQVMKTIKAPFDWTKKLGRAFTERCVGLTKEQIQDYIVFRCLDLPRIEAILASEDGHIRIMLEDAHGETIFHFLRYAQNPLRQNILDSIFACLMKQVPDKTNYGEEEPRREDKQTVFGAKWRQVVMPDFGYVVLNVNGTVRKQLAFIVLCNQTELLKNAITVIGANIKLDIPYLFSIVVKFNLEDMYHLLRNSGYFSFISWTDNRDDYPCAFRVIFDD